MGLYRSLYGAKLEPLIQEELLCRGQIHGAKVRDFFVDVLHVNVDDHAEKLLTELVREGVLRRSISPGPTVSQGAFAGLQFPAQSYRKLDWAHGTRDHYWYFDAKMRPDAVGWDDKYT